MLYMLYIMSVVGYIYIYICAQACSASLKKTLNLSATQHYYYLRYRTGVTVILNPTTPVSP